jgi:CHAD domain-containing protein
MKDNLHQEAKTFGDWAYLAIAKNFHKIIKHEAGVLKDKDPEELHQMRVGIRRLRSAIAGFAPALNLPKNANEKKVGKVACILGELRDIDVLGDSLRNQYQPALAEPEKKQLNKVLEVLDKQRKQSFKQVKDILEAKLYLSLKEAFVTWLETPSYQEIAKISIHNILPDLLLPQVSKLLLHPGWLVGIYFNEGEIQFPNGLEKKQVEEILNNQGKTLHELRKEAKRSRYNMELFTQFYSNPYQDSLKEIKELQTVLGDIQDSFVLAEFLTKTFEENYSNKMPVFAEKLSETRYQKWQSWETLQRKFLNPQTRKDLHMTVLQPNRVIGDW